MNRYRWSDIQALVIGALVFGVLFIAMLNYTGKLGNNNADPETTSVSDEWFVSEP